MLKSTLNSHLMPENCDKLVVPRVDEELWDNVRPVRSMDVKLQKVQHILLKAVAGVVVSAEGLLTLRPKVEASMKEGVKKEVERQLEVASMKFMHAHTDLSFRRRDLIVTSFKSDRYKKLASERMPLNGRLFGDDLKSAMAGIQNASRLGATLNPGPTGQWFLRRRGAGFDASAFRGRARGFARRGNYPYSRGMHTKAVAGHPRCEVRESEKSEFLAGRLKEFLTEWEQITQDKFILNLVRGFKIDFLSKPLPVFSPEICVSKQKEEMIEAEIHKLLQMKVIEFSDHEEG